MNNDMKIIGLVLFFVIILFIITVETIDCKNENFDSNFVNRLEKRLLLQKDQIKSQSEQDKKIRNIMAELTKLRSLSKRYSNLS